MIRSVTTQGNSLLAPVYTVGQVPSGAIEGTNAVKRIDEGGPGNGGGYWVFFEGEGHDIVHVLPEFVGTASAV